MEKRRLSLFVVVTLVCMPFPSNAQARKSIFERTKIKPDPLNGYTRLLRAVEMTEQMRFSSEYYDTARRTGNHSDSEAAIPLQQHLAKMKTLEIEREAVAQYDEVFKLVGEGISMTIENPRQTSDWTTPYYEPAYFKTICRMQSLRADVAFANGTPAVALAAWNQILGIARASQKCNGLIGVPVSITLTLLATRSISKHKERLSLLQIESLSKNIDGLLQAAPARIPYAAEQERASNNTSLENLAKMSPMESKEFLGGDFFDKYSNLPQATKLSELQRAAQLFDHPIKRFLDLSALPESKWIDPPEDVLEPQIEKQFEDDGEPHGTLSDDLNTRLGGASYENILAAEAKYRAILRLCRLQLAIQKYKLELKVYPATLQSLGHPEWILDPLSGGSFQYENYGRTYQLYSKGTSKTGRIDLDHDSPKGDPKLGKNGY